MPKWTLHLAFGFTLTMAVLGLYIAFGPLDIYVPTVIGLIIAVFAAVLGSDLPDFDSRRTRIKYLLGFLLGGFIAVMYLVHVHRDLRPLWDLVTDGFGPFTGYFFVAFLLFAGSVIANTLVWFFPMKHRGRAHSLIACIIYGLFWAAVGFAFLGLNVADSLFAGLLGGVGYLSHLVLDLDIKVWKQ